MQLPASLLQNDREAEWLANIKNVFTSEVEVTGHLQSTAKVPFSKMASTKMLTGPRSELVTHLGV